MDRIEETLRKHIDAFNAHDASAWASHYGPDALVEDPYYPEPLKGPAAAEDDIADLFRAFPDIHADVKRMISQGDTVVVELSIGGTHKGPLELPTGKVEPTNRHFEMKLNVVCDLDAQGKIIEEHRYFDVAGQMSQLGLTH